MCNSDDAARLEDGFEARLAEISAEGLTDAKMGALIDTMTASVHDTEEAIKARVRQTDCK